jgi:hypothetical protein
MLEKKAVIDNAFMNRMKPVGVPPVNLTPNPFIRTIPIHRDALQSEMRLRPDWQSKADSKSEIRTGSSLNTVINTTRSDLSQNRVLTTPIASTAKFHSIGRMKVEHTRSR